MKKIVLLLFTAMSAFGLAAQNTNDDGKVTMVECTNLGVSRPLSDFFVENHPSANFVESNGMYESRDRENRIPQTFVETNTPITNVQSEQGKYQAKTLINWAGQTDGASCPPDPTGAVGLSYYVQAVNASPFKVFNKTTGAIVGTVRQIGSLWSSSNNDGDPIVMYDKFADRWFISQFGSSGNKIYIAISTTNNPSGTYYTYSFTSPAFPDYEKFSIWWDGYYMTSNQSSQNIFCFQRSVMLTGGTPKSFYKTFSPPKPTSGFFCPLPADADGQIPATGTPCPIFSYEDNGWGGTHVDRVNINEMTVNWTPATPTATITQTQLASLTGFDSSYDSGWNDITQPGSSQKLDGIGGVFTYRAPYRAWTGYNSVVLCMGVKISSTQRGIHWFELRQTGGVWSIYQEATYSPADGLSRWCGSIAMDNYGSIGMAYAVTGSGGTGGTVYPSIRYTGRRNTDPLNTFSFSETVGYAGSSSMTGCSNRWGDYCQLSVDPSDDYTFWYTGEYVGTGGNYGTRIISFQIPYYVGIDENQAQNEPGVTVYKSGFNLNVNASNLPSNNQMMVDLFDINGQKINGKTIVPTANAFQTSFNVTGLAAGTYLVRVGETNTYFQKVTKVFIK